MPKRDLNSGLSSPASQPMIRGRGYELSTTNPDAPVEVPAAPGAAPAQEPELSTKLPAIKRENAKLDPELIKAYKKLAVDQDRKLYEVMEFALWEYLKSRE
jgi:hypothetical protein